MINFPDKRYDVIYADPPWDCPARTYSRNEKLEDYYPTMSLETIKAFDIQSISKDNSWLYLWCVDSMLPQALDVCVSWGYEYKKSFIWDKQVFGLGVYNRGQHEQLLMCKRGKPKMPDLSKLAHSVVSV